MFIGVVKKLRLSVFAKRYSSRAEKIVVLGEKVISHCERDKRRIGAEISGILRPLRLAKLDSGPRN